MEKAAETGARRVLVVDDERLSLRLIEGGLRRGGYEVRTCRSGAEALEVAPTFYPDLAIIDQQMPAMSGVETKAALHASPATRDIPVILMSASTIPPVDNVAATITKPVERARLIEIVASLIGGGGAPASGSGAPSLSPIQASEYALRAAAMIEEMTQVWPPGSDPSSAAARVRDLSHRLAGTAASYGFPGIGQAAKDVEEAVSQPQIDRAAVDGLLTELKREAKSMVAAVS